MTLMSRKWLAIVAVLLVVAGVAFSRESVRTQTRILYLFVTGRSPDCPLPRAWSAPNELVRQISFKDRILAASRRLETDAKGYELWETPDGPYWIPKGSHFVLPFNLAEQQRDIYTLGEIRVRRGDVVLDCGANVGVFVRKALSAGASRVVAIEPGPENIECLRRNFSPEINNGRVIVYPKGVWDRDDKLTLHVDPANSAADSFVIQREGAQTVLQLPLTTIDKLVAELALDRVDFIKMDIEGAEVRAIHGARATLNRFHPRLALSAYHQPTDPVEIPSAVRAAWSGYRVHCGPCAIEPERIRPDILFFE